jgi:hypothetical protein
MRVQHIVAAACSVGLLAAPSAWAQATRTWVSGVGSDANPCSRTAPCQTFAGAIAKTAAGGEIDTLDPGGFGAVTVTKSITMAQEGTGEAGILVAGTNGIIVNCSTDPTCVVVVRGLQINGGPVGSNSLAGVKFIAGRGLLIENCSISNFTGPSPNGYGVQFTPGASQGFGLSILNSTITTNGVGITGAGSGGGVLVAPTGGFAANVAVVLDHVRIMGNNAGVRVDNTGGTGGISVTMTGSEVSANANGGVAAVTTSLTAPVIVSIDHSVVSQNNIALNSNGAGSIVRFGSTTVVGNATAFKTSNSGTLSTYGNNQVNDNATVGNAPTSSPLS